MINESIKQESKLCMNYYSDLLFFSQSGQRRLGGAFQSFQLRPAGGAALAEADRLLWARSEAGQTLQHTTPTAQISTSWQEETHRGLTRTPITKPTTEQRQFLSEVWSDV